MSVPTALRVPAKVWATRYFAHPIARALLALHVGPNLLTFAGFLVACAGAWLLAEGVIFWGGVVMLAGAVMDMFDGAVARLGNKVSVFGAFFDSVMDRLGEAVVFFGLAIHYTRAGNELGVALAFAALIASVTVSYARARAEGLGIPGDVGVLGRPERIVVLGAGLLSGYVLWAMGFIAVVAGFTVVQRVWYVWKQAPRS